MSFISYTSELLGLDGSSRLAYFATLVLLLQVAVVFGLIALVLYRRSLRTLTRFRNTSREDKIRRKIIDYYFSYSESETNGPKVKIGFESRGFFRRVLLSTASRFSGSDRNVLVGLYSDLGFLEADLKMMGSFFWWKRLAAIIRLESVRPNQAISSLLKAVEDKNELVAVAAMRALSTLSFPGKASQILDALSRRAPYRKDVFVDILNNLGLDHVDEIIDYLLTCYDPYIAGICISVLGHLRVDRSAEVLLGFTSSSDNEVSKEAVVALGRIKNPRALPYLRDLLKHPSMKVRAAAVEALSRMQDYDSLSSIMRMKSEESVDVRRAVFYALQGHPR